MPRQLQFFNNDIIFNRSLQLKEADVGLVALSLFKIQFVLIQAAKAAAPVPNGSGIVPKSAKELKEMEAKREEARHAKEVSCNY